MWCQKLAWVSPARPRLPPDSKSRPLVKGWGVGACLTTATNPASSGEHGAVEPNGMSFPHSACVVVCPSSQSSLRLDLDSYSTRLHYTALLDAGLTPNPNTTAHAY